MKNGITELMDHPDLLMRLDRLNREGWYWVIKTPFEYRDHYDVTLANPCEGVFCKRNKSLVRAVDEALAEVEGR